MHRSSVDLPLPEAPMSAMTSCSATSRSIPLSTVSSPNDFHRPVDMEGGMGDRAAGQPSEAAADPGGVVMAVSPGAERPTAAEEDAVPAAAGDLPRALAPLAGDQPVREPRERDRHDEEHEGGRHVGREVEVRGDEDLRLAEDLDERRSSTRGRCPSGAR